MDDPYLYDRRFRGGRGRYMAALEEEVIMGMIGPMTGLTVLDLGTGSGRFAALAASGGASRVIGADISRPAVAFARARLRRSPQWWAVMDMQRIALSEASVDRAFAIGTFERLPEHTTLSNLLAEIARVLRPRGTLIFTAWNQDRWLRTDRLDFGRVPRTQFRWIDIEQATARAGFRVIEKCSTFFEPRQLLPILLPARTSNFVTDAMAAALIWINRKLGAGKPGSRGGRELIVLVEKA